MERFQEFLIWVRHTVQLLEPTWLTLVLLGALFLGLFMPQAGEVLSATFAQPGVGRGLSLAALFLYLSTFILSISSWFTTRVLLSYHFGRNYGSSAGRGEFVPHVPRDFSDGPWGRRIRAWFPRLLGALPPLVIAVRLLTRPDVSAWNALWMAALAATPFLFVKLRRFLPGIGTTDELASDRLLPTLGTWKGILVALALNSAIFFALILLPVAASRMFGAAAILVFAVAGWVMLGNLFFVYPGYALFDRHWWPRLTPIALLVLWVIAVEPWTHDHALRGAVAGSRAASARTDIAAHVDDWLNERGASKADPVALIIATAEGGGIRAAYWTASVLGRLSDKIPGFACHLFAISGVSGGSVGAVAYAAIVASELETGTTLCGEGATTTRHVRERAQALLAEDYLSPAVAGLVAADLAQRVVPFAPLPDRADYFEHGLETSWGSSRTAGSASGSASGVRLQDDFLTLWDDERDVLVPSLFLNATHVERGRRATISNLRWQEAEFRDREPQADRECSASLGAEDLLAHVPGAITISSASHAGARFPIVSPPGTVLAAAGDRPWGRVVDGGYFENSGGQTASELSAVVRRACNERCRIFHLVLSNDPSHPALYEDLPPPRAGLPAGLGAANRRQVARCLGTLRGDEPRRRLVETRSILDAFWNARSARGQLGERTFWNTVETTDRAAFRLHPRVAAHDPALGWLLDANSQRNMSEQADALDLAPLRELLGVAPAAAPASLSRGCGACLAPLDDVWPPDWDPELCEVVAPTQPVPARATS